MSLGIEFIYNEQLRAEPKDLESFRQTIEDLYQDINSNDVSRKAEKLGELGFYLRISGNLKSAEKKLNESLQIISENNLGKKKEIQQKIRLGHVLQFRKKFQESNQLFSKIIDECNNHDELNYFLPFAWQHSGKNDFDQGKYQKALDSFRIALELRVKNECPTDQLESTKFAIQRTEELIEREFLLAKMYNEVSGSYNEKINEAKYIVPAWLQENISSFVKEDAKNLLDLGCANGINAKNILKINPLLEVVGIDISPTMIEEARKNNIFKSLYTLNLDKGFTFLEKNTFDIILALGCLEFVTNIDFCLDEISRVSAKNAEVYATFQLFDPENEFAPKTSRSGSVIHYAYSKKEVETFFISRNFSILKMEGMTGYVGGYPCQYLMVIAKKN